MQQLMRNRVKKFEWNERAQEAFENVSQELFQAPVLGRPREKGMCVLYTGASPLAVSWILHQEQELNGITVLRPIAYDSKVLSDTEMNHSSPKAELFAVVTFLEKYRAYLVGSASFKLRENIWALSWLKTYSMDQDYIGRWIVSFDGYQIIIEQRMRDKYQNADSLSKKLNFTKNRNRSRPNSRKSMKGSRFVFRQRDLRIAYTDDMAGQVKTSCTSASWIKLEKRQRLRSYSKRTRCPSIWCYVQTWLNRNSLVWTYAVFHCSIK